MQLQEIIQKSCLETYVEFTSILKVNHVSVPLCYWSCISGGGSGQQMPTDVTEKNMLFMPDFA
jgi:hypothetical protein